MAESIKTLVVDASFVLSFLLPDEEKPESDQVFTDYKEGRIRLISSPILPFEVLNALKTAVKQKRIEKSRGEILGQSFLKLHIYLERMEYAEIFVLALKHDITVYDASYLFVAQKLDVSLRTFDKALQKLN